MFEQEQLPEAHRGKWFLGCGILGVAVAATLTWLMIQNAVPTSLTLALWPTSIAAIGDPHTFTEKLLTAVITFGGQFALYGIAGLLVGSGINAIRVFLSRR
jgi:hypothetical protein